MDNLKWYEKTGPSGDVACSTRVRLARNLGNFPFPSRASLEQKEQIAQQVKEALINSNSVISQEFQFLPMDGLTDQAAASMLERRLVSPAFLSNRQGKAILASLDESLSIMINEEDHIRIQVLREGIALKEAAETADRIDTLLGETLNFAFDKDFGYLTQCPTNLGTGMRASLMLHLPCLNESGAMPRIAATLAKLGLTLRGAFGEGSRAVGDMFQLSNQITLGLSEGQAIENLSAIANQLIEEERKLRHEFLESLAWQDKITRAAGTLKSARLLSSSEADQLLSLARLGVCQGTLQGMEPGELSGLGVRVQPATLASSTEQNLNQEQRDQLRAKLVRESCAALREG